MKKAILDTSFILTCVKQKIDFAEDLAMKGFHLIVPKEVILELEGLSKSDDDAKLALKLIGKTSHEIISLTRNKVDDGIIHYAEENPDVAVASLDKEIKKSIDNHKIVVRGKKSLEVQ